MRVKYSEMHDGSDLAFYHMSLGLGPTHLYIHTHTHNIRFE